MSEAPALSRNADFLRLWSGFTIARLGSQISVLALPLTAVLLLSASATDTGLLVAAQNRPTLLLAAVIAAAAFAYLLVSPVRAFHQPDPHPA